MNLLLETKVPAWQEKNIVFHKQKASRIWVWPGQKSVLKTGCPTVVDKHLCEIRLAEIKRAGNAHFIPKLCNLMNFELFSPHSHHHLPPESLYPNLVTKPGQGGLCVRTQAAKFTRTVPEPSLTGTGLLHLPMGRWRKVCSRREAELCQSREALCWQTMHWCWIWTQEVSLVEILEQSFPPPW